MVGCSLNELILRIIFKIYNNHKIPAAHLSAGAHRLKTTVLETCVAASSIRLQLVPRQSLLVIFSIAKFITSKYLARSLNVEKLEKRNSKICFGCSIRRGSTTEKPSSQTAFSKTSSREYSPSVKWNRNLRKSKRKEQKQFTFKQF